MFRIKESIHVNAPLDRCFLLATNVTLVQQTIKLTPVAGRTSGLIVGDDHVKWSGWKFGLPVSHESVISRYEPHSFFQDTQHRGWFRFFQHDHRFEEIDGRTLMVDIVRFSMPFGWPGREVGKRIIVPHVLGLVQRRFQLLKRIAEGDDWQRYLAVG